MALAATGAWAAEQPLYLPAPAWVKPIPLPKAKPENEEGAAQVLLQNAQSLFSADHDEFYQESAVKIRTAEGLSQWGNVIVSWRPDTETLVLHKLQILRGAEVIDLLGGGKKVTVLRRETNLEMAMLDGALTATVQPEGLQVGDVLSFAYTRISHDPVLKGRSEDWAYLSRPGVVTHAYVRALWPKAKAVRFHATEGLGKGAERAVGDDRELVFDLSDVEAPPPPRGAPVRYQYLAEVQLSDFANWADVSALSAPLYDKAATLAPNSALRAEIQKIKEQSTDPKVRAMAALKLVEDKIRYLFIGLNNGGYVPAEADVTWERRFGDCKAKTALLLAMLKELGIEAQPVLVNTERGDALHDRLPSMGAFDHVAVRARIGGETYWLDGTRIGDTDIGGLPHPNFRWVLPVQASGGDLERQDAPVYGVPHIETMLRVDATAGLDSPAPAHAEHKFRGDEGLAIQMGLKALSRMDLDRRLRAYWRQALPWVEAKSVAFTPDAGQGVILSVDGLAAMDWSKDTDGRSFLIGESNIGSDANFKREPGPNREAPFLNVFPLYAKRSVTVVLPKKGEGFVIGNGGAIDQTLAGTEYKRTAKIENGVATVEVSVRALTPEVTYADAFAATATLREWNLHSVVIMANSASATNQLSGYVREGRALAAKKDWSGAIAQFDAAARNDPLSAPVYASRGFVYQAKGDLDLALADFDKALKLRPADAITLRNRGLVHAARNDWAKAIDDYDAAIKVKADYAEAYLSRGFAHMAQRKFNLAIADCDAVLKLRPNDPDGMNERGLIYQTQGDHTRAIADFDQALKLAPLNAFALHNRGLSHVAQKDLPRGMADFTASIQAKPDFADAYNSRGYGYQTQQNWDLALSDYDAALKIAPDHRLALINRAHVQMIKGAPEKAMGDLTNVIRLDPRNAFAYADRGLAHARMHDVEAAFADTDQAIRLKPDLGSALSTRGVIRIGRGEVDAGFKDLDEAARLSPQDAGTLNTGCWERAKAGRDLNRALALCQAALALRPDDAQVIDSRGFVRFRRGEYEAAVADFDKAVKIAPKQAASLYVRGLAEERLKRTAQAEADIAAAKAMDPSVTDAYAKIGVTASGASTRADAVALSAK